MATEPSNTARGAGRKPDLTPDKSRAICDLLKVGASKREAAIASGQGESTFHHWYATGEKALEKIKDAEAKGRKPPKLSPYEDLCVQFKRDVDQTEAKFSVRVDGSIAKGMLGYEEVETISRQKTVMAKRKTVYPDGRTVYDEEPKIVTEIDTKRSHKFDPNLALQWKRHRRAKEGWSTRVDIELDDEITRLLAQLAGAGEEEAS